MIHHSNRDKKEEGFGDPAHSRVALTSTSVYYFPVEMLRTQNWVSETFSVNV